jgi:hypothetical protein
MKHNPQAITTAMQMNISGESQRNTAKTPAEAAGIKVEGQDKWLTIIQNAAKRKH